MPHCRTPRAVPDPRRRASSRPSGMRPSAAVPARAEPARRARHRPAGRGRGRSPRGTTRLAAVREHGVCRGEIKRGDEAGPEGQRRHVRQTAKPASLANRRTAASRSLLQRDRRLVVRLEHRLAQRQLSGSSPSAFRGVHSSVPAARSISRSSMTETGDRPCVEGGGIDERLERGPGLAAAARGAVERRLPEVASADDREHVAGRGSSATSAACSPRLAQSPEAVRHRLLGRVLHGGEQGRVHLPVRRLIAAEARSGTAAAGTPLRIRRGRPARPGAA